MSRTVVVQFNLPGDLGRFSMPRALDERLQDLLDRQDETGKLTARERREAKALVDLADLLSLLRLRVQRTTGPKT